MDEDLQCAWLDKMPELLWLPNKSTPNSKFPLDKQPRADWNQHPELFPKFQPDLFRVSHKEHCHVI